MSVDNGNRLNRELNALQQPKVLVIDEIGYLPFDAVQASLLFQVICRRYQRSQPLILTSNKPFGDWGQVFGDDPVMASAALDRLLHRSTIVNIRRRLTSQKLLTQRIGHSLRDGIEIHLRYKSMWKGW